MTKNEQLIKIFEYALTQEKNGLNFFQNALKQLDISATKNAFIRLIEEEEKHVEYIERILKGLKEGPTLETSDFKVKSLKKTQFFDKKTKAEFNKQLKEGSQLPDVAIFNTAWLIEKDISEFYAQMARQTDGEAKKVLGMLARWERGHEEFFREYRDKLLNVYSDIFKER